MSWHRYDSLQYRHIGGHDSVVESTERINKLLFILRYKLTLIFLIGTLF